MSWAFGIVAGAPPSIWRWEALLSVGVAQRRYFSEKSTSKLRGISACLRADAPVMPLLVLSGRLGVFLLDHCQAGFAVIFTIG